MKLMTIEEAKEYLRMEDMSDASFLNGYVYGIRPQITSFKIGNHRRFRREDLDKFILSRIRRNEKELKRMAKPLISKT